MKEIRVKWGLFMSKGGVKMMKNGGVKQSFSWQIEGSFRIYEGNNSED